MTADVMMDRIAEGRITSRPGPSGRSCAARTESLSGGRLRHAGRCGAAGRNRDATQLRAGDGVRTAARVLPGRRRGACVRSEVE